MPSRDSRRPPPSSSPAVLLARAGTTRHTPAGGAAGALAAPRQEGHHDPLPHRQVGDPGAELLDPAGWPRGPAASAPGGAVAVDDGQVGVADAGGLDPHEHLAGRGRGEVERAHGEWTALGVGTRPPDLLEDRPRDLHQRWSTACWSTSRTTWGIGTLPRESRPM